MVTILAKTGFDTIATELLRADTVSFSFTKRDADPGEACADLGEAIAVLAARPVVDRALAEATAAVATRFDDVAFARQVALVKERAVLEARLANLMLDDKEASQGTEGH